MVNSHTHSTRCIYNSNCRFISP
uniref:Uncharacterized protein n=1 Tax=Anguilla anguilla TaxID=7936 RepID=A0A0E9TKP8_ANGAN